MKNQKLKFTFTAIKKVQARGKNVRWMVAFLTAASIFLASATQTIAATSQWDIAWEGLNALHDQVSLLKMSLEQESNAIKELRKRNNEALKTVNAKGKTIDQALLNRLQTEAKSAEKKYAPLLDQYTSISKQAAAAKKSKNKKSADLLDLKRNQLKVSATAARSEIKTKKTAYSSAKKQASAKIKVVKDALVPVQNVKKQIAAENKKIAQVRKALTASDKAYRSSVKDGNAVSAMVHLKLVYDFTGQIHASQTKIFNWEKEISRLITAASTKIPA